MVARPSLRIALTLMGLCSGAKAQSDRARDRNQPVVQLRRDWATRPGLFSFPTAIAVVGPYVIVIDYHADTLGSVLDAASGLVLQRFGPRGVAPGHLSTPISLAPDPRAQNVFWVLDGQTARLCRFSLNSSVTGLVVVPDSLIPVPGPKGEWPLKFFVARNGTFIFVGLFNGPRFARLTTTQHGLEGFGPFPPGTDSVPLYIRQHLFQTTLAPHPKRDIFAAATRFSDRLDLFADDGSQVATARRLRDIEPLFALRQKDAGIFAEPGPDTRYAYLALAADSMGVDALFSGRNHLEASGRAGSGSIVERYSWSAVRVRVYGLDADAVAIATDEGAHALFALVNARLPSVVRYALPR